MSFGLNVRNTGAGYVIDGDYINPRMIRKGVMATYDSPIANEHNFIAEIPINAGEILAFACVEPAIFAGVRDGKAIISAYAPGPNQSYAPVNVEYWIFNMSDTGSSNFGLRVWNATAQKVFDSAWKILKVMGAQGAGSSVGYASGRKYAVIPQEVRVTMRREQAVDPNATLPTVVSRILRGDAARVVGPTVSVEPDKIVSQLQFGMFPGGASIAGWTVYYDNALTTRYIIIDVTNY